MSYSQRILFIKIVLPLIGIVALVLALVVNWNDDAQIADKFSDEDKSFVDSKVNAVAPSVDIETKEGDRYRIAADNVESTDGEADFFSGGDVVIDMRVGGNDVKVKSRTAEVDREKQVAVFIDEVVGEIDQKYTIISQELTADIAKREVTTDKRVRVEKGNSFVEADSFRLTGPEGKRQITFEGNVSGELFAPNKEKVDESND